jgi:ankyrin repeat/BTB/POZ domain-containing protein 1
MAPTNTPFKAQVASRLFSTSSDFHHGDINDENSAFNRLCDACRRGDASTVQSLISFEKVDINAVDEFDYPPLTLVGRPSSLTLHRWSCGSQGRERRRS